MDIDHPVQQAFIALLEEINKMSSSGTELYLQLHKVKSIVNILSEKQDALTEAVLEEMLENKEEKKEFEFGKFTVGNRSKWKYSENIKPLEEALKTAKKTEEEDGIATKEITSYLLVK